MNDDDEEDTKYVLAKVILIQSIRSFYASAMFTLHMYEGGLNALIREYLRH